MSERTCAAHQEAARAGFGAIDSATRQRSSPSSKYSKTERAQRAYTLWTWAPPQSPSPFIRAGRSSTREPPRLRVTDAKSAVLKQPEPLPLTAARAIPCSRLT